jgi:hypothetical protein
MTGPKPNTQALWTGDWLNFSFIYTTRLDFITLNNLQKKMPTMVLLFFVLTEIG